VKPEKNPLATREYVDTTLKITAQNLRNEASNVSRQIREKFDATHTAVNGLTSNQELLKQFANQQAVINKELVAAVKKLDAKVESLASAEEKRKVAERQANCSHPQISIDIREDGLHRREACLVCGKEFFVVGRRKQFKAIWRFVTGK
jgi:hypothetical protein